MLNVFVNTAIVSNDSSCLEQLTNGCFAPFRYLFQGRKVEIWNHIVIDNKETSAQRHWTKMAAAILLLVPGLLVGALIKFLDYCLFASTRNHYTLLQKYEQNPYPLQDSLDVSHAQLDKMATSIKNQMTSKKVWKEPAFMAEVSHFMEIAYQEMEMFFDELEGRFDGDPAKIARAMAQDGLKNPKNDEGMGSMYLYFYFYSSLTEIYHLARSCAYIENFSGNKQIFHFPLLTIDDQDPYFTFNTPQYQWRTLYNNFCERMGQIEGLLDHLNRENGRFISWAQLDDQPDSIQGFPDTRPTFLLPF